MPYDNSAVVEELQTLNEAVNSQSEALDQIEEYITIKREAEEAEAEKAEADKAEEESIKEEETAKADSETQIYTELLTEIDEGIKLQNQLMVAQSIYIGIVVGLLFMKILFDRIFK